MTDEVSGTHEIGQTIQLLSQQTPPTHHPSDPPVERIKPESEHGQKVRPVQTPHGLGTRCSAHIGAQAEIVDAQEDAQGATNGVSEGDDVGHSKVSDEGKVTFIVGVGFQSGLFLPFLGDGGALPYDR